MKQLCRAIVWDVIVLGGNRKGGKLFGGNYVNSIYLGSIIQGQLSGWQLCGYNHQWWITLRGNSLTPIAQKLIIWVKDDYREGNIFGGNYPKRNYPRGGAIVGEQLSGAQLSCSHHSLQRNLCGILKFTERPKTPGILWKGTVST